MDYCPESLVQGTHMTVVVHPVEVELKYDVYNARCTCDDSKLRRGFQGVSKNLDISPWEEFHLHQLAVASLR